MEDHTTIYVALLDEGTPTWRPVEAVRIQDDVFEIISQNPDPDDEIWEFNVGQHVRCEKRELSNGVYMVAAHEI